MNWQDATVDTIKRLREVNALSPLTFEHRVALYAEARAIALSVAPQDSNKFWNIFLNVLRIFIAAEADEPITKADLYTKVAQCTKKSKSGRRRDDQDDHWMTSGRGLRHSAGT